MQLKVNNKVYKHHCENLVPFFVPWRFQEYPPYSILLGEIKPKKTSLTSSKGVAAFVKGYKLKLGKVNLELFHQKIPLTQFITLLRNHKRIQLRNLDYSRSGAKRVPKPCLCLFWLGQVSNKLKNSNYAYLVIYCHVMTIFAHFFDYLGSVFCFGFFSPWEYD